MKKILLIILFLFPFVIFAQENKEEEKINTEVFLRIGNSVKLELPKDTFRSNIVWQSSNTQIAEVDEDGVVIGKSSGEVVITGNTTEGYKYEYTVKVASTASYYWTIVLNFVKKNLIAFEILAVLGLIFVFIKLAY